MAVEPALAESRDHLSRGHAMHFENGIGWRCECGDGYLGTPADLWRARAAHSREIELVELRAKVAELTVVRDRVNAAAFKDYMRALAAEAKLARVEALAETTDEDGNARYFEDVDETYGYSHQRDAFVAGYELGVGAALDAARS